MPKPQTASRKTRAIKSEDFSLTIEAKLTGCTAHAFLAMVSFDRQAPSEWLAELIRENIGCWMEARASAKQRGSLPGVVTCDAK